MKNSIDIKSSKNGSIRISAIPGHFATSHSHVNYYIDITSVKHEHIMARNAGVHFASQYANVPIETIICMDGSEVIGAFIAGDLSKSGMMMVNENQSINVLPTEYDINRQMIFRDNLRGMVAGKPVLLLIASITTGKTATRALESISYYGGTVVGIASIFSVMDEIAGIPVDTIFSHADIRDYATYLSKECPLCKRGDRIDALANSYGYSVLGEGR